MFHIAKEQPAEVEYLRKLNLDPYRKDDDRETLIKWIESACG